MNLHILGMPRHHEDDARTQSARLGHLHPGADAEGLALIAGGDGAGIFALDGADDDGPAAPVGVLLLFDAGEEGVQVDEQPAQPGGVFIRLSAGVLHDVNIS